MNLSVVVPGYNTSDRLWRRCLNSILAEPSVGEIICVDDASSFWPDVLEEFSNGSNPRVKVIKLAVNKGQAFARNEGMRHVTGKFIAFVDSDDEVLPGTYTKAMTAILSSTADVLVYGVKTIWHREQLYKVDRLDDAFIGILSPNALENLCKQTLFNYPWNKIYRKSFLDKNKILFQEKCIPSEDEIFNLHCVISGAKWATIEHIGQLYYRQDGTSLSRYRRYNVESLMGVDAAWRRCKELLNVPPGILEKKGNMKNYDFILSEWNNIWRQGSPYSLIDRWNWLRRHPDIGGLFIFLKALLLMVGRKYFYIKPIRKWRIRHLYPNVFKI